MHPKTRYLCFVLAMCAHLPRPSRDHLSAVTLRLLAEALEQRAAMALERRAEG